MSPPKPLDPIDNLTAFIPALFVLDGKPMTLDDHFTFHQLFSTCLPPFITFRGSRQIGKTYGLMARILLEAAMKPGHKTLTVLPLQDQSDRVSNLVHRPLLMDSPIRTMLRGVLGDSVRIRQFGNSSLHYFYYAGADVQRIRQMNTNWVLLDESMLIDPSHVPVIQACMDGKPEPLMFIAGTSKTKDTLLEDSWEKSSQAVWHVKCHHCGFDNVCCLEPDGHLISMIGPLRDDICEERPGTVCHSCQEPVIPRFGRWVHRAPELAKSHVGYFIPQIVMPSHYASVVKWRMLTGKMAGGGQWTTAKFYNEVLGEAYDMAFKMLSRENLRTAAQGVGPNTEHNATWKCRNYRVVILGVDWGGGGEDGVSRTKVVAVGLNAFGKLEAFFGAQLAPTTDHVAEAKDVLRIAKFVNASYVAHDANGSGAVSESVLNSLGLALNQIVPMIYRQNVGGDMIVFRKPTGARIRGLYDMDKGRSLQFLCMAIRAGYFRFFDYDYVDADRPGLLEDFTALVSETIDTPTGEVYRIRKIHKSRTDDFAHACNFAASALWELTNSWPSLAVAGAVS